MISSNWNCSALLQHWMLQFYVPWKQSNFISELFFFPFATFKEFMKKLEEKRVALNKATSMGEAILTICHPDSITTIKHWNTIIKARFEEVSSQLHACIHAFQLCHSHRYDWTTQFGWFKLQRLCYVFWTVVLAKQNKINEIALPLYSMTEVCHVTVTGAGLGQAAPAATGHGPHWAVSHSGAAGESAHMAAVGWDQPQR